MLPILKSQSDLTMSSREIAELVGTTHDSVLKTIREYSARGVVSGNETPYRHPQNKQTYSEFHLCKRDALVIASGYSVELRARIIDRWQELESRSHQAIPNFNDPVAAARAWADAKESEIKAIQYAEAAKPAVEFVERCVQSTGNLGFRQVCKLLKAKENDFRAFLQDNRIMYRLGSDWVPYAPHIDAGRFYVTTGTGDNDHNFTSAKFTAKGVEWVAKLWGNK